MDEQKVRILVLGSRSVDITSFIESIGEHEVVHASPNLNAPVHQLPQPLPIVFRPYLVTKSLRLFFFGFKDWMWFFRLADLQPFVKEAHAFVILIDSTDSDFPTGAAPILDKVRSYKEIPHTVIAIHHDQSNVLSVERLREILYLTVDEDLISCAGINAEEVKRSLLRICIKYEASTRRIEEISHFDTN